MPLSVCLFSENIQDKKKKGIQFFFFFWSFHFLMKKMKNRLDIIFRILITGNPTYWKKKEISVANHANCFVFLNSQKIIRGFVEKFPLYGSIWLNSLPFCWFSHFFYRIFHHIPSYLWTVDNWVVEWRKATCLGGVYQLMCSAMLCDWICIAGLSCKLLLLPNLIQSSNSWLVILQQTVNGTHLLSYLLLWYL